MSTTQDTKQDDIISQFQVKDNNKWKSEEELELETLKKSRLKIARIVYEEEDPPKRCIAFSKNRRSVAFDIEMVPAVIAVLKKLTPSAFLPEELRDKY